MRGSSSEQVLLIYKGNLRIGRRLKETNSYIDDGILTLPKFKTTPTTTKT